MATTQRGIYYPNNYEAVADVPEDMKDMAESIDDAMDELDNAKVDKVAGKGLSTNDYDNTEQGKVTANTAARHTHSNKAVLDATTASYTTEEKNKLAGLENYDDTDIVEEIEALQTENAELKEQVEDLENNQLEATTTGETIYLPDSASAKNRGIGIVGNKEQYSTTGKQAIISLYEKSLNSITWSFDKNKAVSSMVFSGIVSVGVDTAAVYIQTSEGAIRLPTYLTESANTKFTYNATLSETILTNIANSTFNPRISIYKGGVDFSNATYSEMMLRDSTTTDTYEPYTGRNSLS